MDNLTRFVAEKVVALRFEDLPVEAINQAKAVIVDGCGVMLAGYTEPTGLGRTIVDFVRSQGGTDESTVMGGWFRTSAVNAAFANGTMHHALDYDNTWYPLTHPTSPTWPAILAVGERVGATGPDILMALVIAFEVQGRLRMATPDVPIRTGFHPPGLFGLMGATTAAGKLLALSMDQLVMAYGIAASRAGSVVANIGSRTKSTHCGHAARMGVECALLAKVGWTAHPDIFGDGGILETFAPSFGPPDLGKVSEGFGAPYRIVDPGVGFKKHPCHYFTHRPIDAALAMRSEYGFMATDIDTVTVRFPPFPDTVRPAPATGLDGKFSVQYTTAAAFLDGRITIDTFSDERRFAPDMEAMLPRINVVLDPKIPLDFQTMYAVVEVALGDGRRLEKRIDKPRGMWGVPLTRDERVAKYRDCAARLLSSRAVDALLERLETLEECRHVDEIVSAMRQ
jgi:aconitate decarboxylase